MPSMNNGKFCTKCGGKLIEHVEQEKTVATSNIKEKVVYKSNLKGIIALTCSFLVLIGVLITVGVMKFNDYEEQLELKNNTISSKNKKISEYESKLSDTTWESIKYEEKAKFLDENIVFVLDGYANYYYTYDQVQQVTQGVDEYTYWAYNKEQAISRGYKKWK